MKNTNTTSADVPNTFNDVYSQAEDAAHKTLAQFFRDELLTYFHIEGEVDHIAPTETVHLEIKKFYQDFNFVMKDGGWIHFEFQSTDNKALDDLKRFRCYEALTNRQHKVDIRTYVLFSGTIEKPLTEFTCGFNTYRVQPIIMKGHLAEEVFDNINYKLEHSIPLTKEDLVPLTLCPLMGGDIPQLERIQKAIRIIHQHEHVIEHADKLEAIIYAMASKFLNESEHNQIKEEIKMTELGALIYNDGIEAGKIQGIELGKTQGIELGKVQGAKEASQSNARKLFENGVSFEVVRTSFDILSNQELLEIFNEVSDSKNT